MVRDQTNATVSLAHSRLKRFLANHDSVPVVALSWELLFKLFLYTLGRISYIVSVKVLYTGTIDS